MLNTEKYLRECFLLESALFTVKSALMYKETSAWDKGIHIELVELVAILPLLVDFKVIIWKVSQ